MTLSKKSVAAVLAAAIGAGAVLPAASMAATTTTVKQTKTYNIKVDQGILTNGAGHVKAKVVVTNPDAAVKDWYSRATIARSSTRASTTASRSRTTPRATAACPCSTAR